MATIITPTVGCVVCFYPDGSTEHTQPRASIITAVWGDRCVNLAVFEENGVPVSHPPASVTLLQENDAPPRRGDGTLAQHCRWMPYQAAEKALAEAGK